MKQQVNYDPKAGKNYLHPGRQANIIYDGEVIGYLGEIHPEVADNYKLGARTYVAVLDMPYLVERASFERKFQGIAKYPAVTRDISMVMSCLLYTSELMPQSGESVTGWSLLPSGYFYMDAMIEDGVCEGYLIHGGGYGHGCGMSQNGAMKMAEMGKGYDEILRCV